MGLDSENIIHVENRTTLEITFAEKVGKAIREEFATKTENKENSNRDFSRRVLPDTFSFDPEV